MHQNGCYDPPVFVLVLHGPPASGKYTIGKQVAARLEVPLFHNHLTVDLALALFPFGSPGFVRLREEIWLAAFRAAAAAGRSFVFTFHPEATVEPGLIELLGATVEDAGGQAVYVELLCSDAVLEERLGHESRRRFGKLADVGLFRRLRDGGAFNFPPLPEPVLRVDTAALSPELAAAAITEALVTRFPAWFAPPKSPPVSTG